jgi:four helix bundle protein
MAIKTYRELEVWQRAMMLVEQCYDETNSFPQNELIGLTGQLRRAAISIPSNVAEGSRRLTTQAFMNHVGIARGSLAEVETCIEVARRLGYLPESKAKALDELAGSVGRLLSGLIRALRSNRPRP